MLFDLREHEQLAKYGDINTARQTMVVELKKLIEVNPALYDKLQFPNIKSSRLRYLINQRCYFSIYLLLSFPLNLVIYGYDVPGFSQQFKLAA